MERGSLKRRIGDGLQARYGLDPGILFLFFKFWSISIADAIIQILALLFLKESKRSFHLPVFERLISLQPILRYSYDAKQTGCRRTLGRMQAFDSRRHMKALTGRKCSEQAFVQRTAGEKRCAISLLA